MNQLWYHIKRLALVIIPVLFAVAPAMAQLQVYQGQTTKLTVSPQPGDTYTWELYTDSTLNFATTTGNVPSSKAEFVNGINTGPSVEVIWHEPGVYFVKVEAWDAVACTNNLKIGRFVVLEDQDAQIDPPIAVDDYYEVDCDALFATITINDEWDDQYNIYINVLDDAWPTQGSLTIDGFGQIQYSAWFGVFGTDSFKYELCLDLDRRLCDTATVYLHIPADLDCDDPTITDTTCHFFIPEGFSPNGDGVHDYFEIDCIDKYPYAKLMIFDKQGYMLYQKDRYGNTDIWGYQEADLWWGGQTTKHHQNDDQMVVPGVYLYILDKGNGDLARGFVMVAYGKNY